MATTQTPHRQSHPAGAGGSATAHDEFIGLLGQFDDPDSLIDACEQARNAGYQKMDAFSPFPVHGIDAAIGIRRSRLPFFVLAIGMCGCAFGIFMQWYCNRAADSPLFPGYDFIISGKPLWSLPANIPVTFECIVLSSAFATFFGMLFLNRLPRLANPLHRISRFKRATNDRFFLMIDAADAKFDAAQTQQQLNDWGASAVEEVRSDLTDREMPKFFRTFGVIFALLLLIPPALIYRSNYMTSPHARLHVIPDMDWQYRFRSQDVGPNWTISRQENYMFNDVRVMRAPLAGTIGRGYLRDNTEYYTGIQAEVAANAAIPTTAGSSIAGPRQDEASAQQDDAAQQEPAAGDAAQAVDPAVEPEPNWITEFPLNVDAALMARGRDRFNIYCTACHGYSGEGTGLVNQRALELAASSVIQKGTSSNAAWTQAKSFFDPTVINQPVGRIFDTITHGRGTMGPYGSQISTRDRWAIVLYVKSLQATRAKEVADAMAKAAAEAAAAEQAQQQQEVPDDSTDDAADDESDNAPTDPADDGSESSENATEASPAPTDEVPADDDSEGDGDGEESGNQLAVVRNESAN